MKKQFTRQRTTASFPQFPLFNFPVQLLIGFQHFSLSAFPFPGGRVPYGALAQYSSEWHIQFGAVPLLFVALDLTIQVQLRTQKHRKTLESAQHLERSGAAVVRATPLKSPIPMAHQ